MIITRKNFARWEENENKSCASIQKKNFFVPYRSIFLKFQEKHKISWNNLIFSTIKWSNAFDHCGFSLEEFKVSGGIKSYSSSFQASVPYLCCIAPFSKWKSPRNSNMTRHISGKRFVEGVQKFWDKVKKFHQIFAYFASLTNFIFILFQYQTNKILWC